MLSSPKEMISQGHKHDCGQMFPIGTVCHQMYSLKDGTRVGIGLNNVVWSLI